MIVLFSYSINLYGSSNGALHSSTGGQYPNDSVLISYDDLRIANSKMIELKYEKEKNTLLEFQHQLDSIHIDTQDELINTLQDDNKQITKQRNLANIVSGASIATLILVLLFK